MERMCGLPTSVFGPEWGAMEESERCILPRRKSAEDVGCDGTWASHRTAFVTDD